MAATTQVRILDWTIFNHVWYTYADENGAPLHCDFHHNTFFCSRLSSVVEHALSKRKVAGSKPAVGFSMCGAKMVTWFSRVTRAAVNQITTTAAIHFKGL